MVSKVGELIKEVFVSLNCDEMGECSKLVKREALNKLGIYHKVLVKLSIFDDGTVLQEGISNGTGY